MRYVLKPNFRALGPKLGKKVQLAKQALARADAGALRAAVDQLVGVVGFGGVARKRGDHRGRSVNLSTALRQARSELLLS